MKTTSKKVIRATVKTLRAEAGAVRAQWMLRGVAEGEFEQVKALEDKAWALDCDKRVEQIDSSIR